MASSGPAAVPVVPTTAAGSAEPMAPASPEPKRPRQHDSALPTAMTRDVTLPELVKEVAELRPCFGRDEVFAIGMHDAVGHNALLLGEVLGRLTAMESNLGSAEAVVAQLGADAKVNDDALDAKLRAELGSVTSRLGNELRPENSRMQESFDALKGIALGAAAAVRAGPTASPPGPPNLAALESNFSTLDGRTSAISIAVHTLTADLTLCNAQVNDLVSAVSTLQYVAPAQHSSFAASAGAADTSSAAADCIARDMGGWSRRPDLRRTRWNWAMKPGWRRSRELRREVVTVRREVRPEREGRLQRQGAADVVARPARLPCGSLGRSRQCPRLCREADV